jgi:tRNA A-37 threonylcarbamoyl transferase component Bud32/DNA-binding NarL/FixJ family response regulator
MPARVLLIHDADEARSRVVQSIAGGMPSALIEMWDPTRQGAPGRGFDWKRFDLIFLDERPGNADGIEWLIVLKEAIRAGLVPPMVMLAITEDAERERRARSAGAADVIRKSELAPDRVAAAARASLRTPAPSTAAQAAGGAAAGVATSQMNVGAIGQPAGAVSLAIPGYRVLRKLAEGGMSKVYLAERASDRTILVLKMLDPKLNGDPLFRQRFVREYQILQRIRNRHVVSIMDQGMTDDYGYIAMEYFPGGDLKSMIRPPGFAPPVAVRNLMQIAQGLEAVHEAGVVHRDLKPQNIMFRADGDLAILDFGLARELDSTATLTQKGVVLATPLYMSPEQCLGLPHDARGDLYSVGVLFHEMLTGRTPFTGKSPPELAYQHVHAAVPQLPGYLLSLQPLVNKLLAKKPEDRYQSATQLLDQLRAMVRR